ncbi:ubiquitin-conjugating enzyme/RWD-like protein [Aspergillus spectabilis]
MSRSLRRLMKESTELTATPSPHFHAAPISDSNLYDWHFTLVGPPSPSPYSGGIYHGRITFPPTYPLRPPSFRFLTPSGRFEVNREICLSISGHHEETWQPAWGVRTALLAIRSFMGMSGEGRGQVGGLEVSDEVRREWAVRSRGWRCAACEGSRGRSNEVVLGEWRRYCVEMGVDVEREDGGEGVPEGLTVGVKKDKGEKEKEDSMAQADKTTTVVAADSDAMRETPTIDTEKSAAAPDLSAIAQGLAPSKTIPAPTSAQTSASTWTSTSTPQVLMQRHQQQQEPTPTPTPTPTRTIPAPAPVASQDSPWLDRAIFGVLVALVLMILRRFIDLED